MGYKQDLDTSKHRYFCLSLRRRLDGTRGGHDAATDQSELFDGEVVLDLDARGVELAVDKTDTPQLLDQRLCAWHKVVTWLSESYQKVIRVFPSTWLPIKGVDRV